MSTTNPYFNQFGETSEQDLLNELTIEAIQIFGMSVYYIKQEFVNLDNLFGEDPLAKLSNAYEIEAYFQNIDGWGGPGNMIGPTGMAITKEANYAVSRTRFQEILDPNGQFPNLRPMEGDVIYNPLTHDLWEVTRADHENIFYQLGAYYVWQIHTEKLVYSSKRIDTGIPEIDAIGSDNENLDNLINDPNADNTRIADSDVEHFNPNNPFAGNN